MPTLENSWIRVGLRGFFSWKKIFTDVTKNCSTNDSSARWSCCHVSNHRWVHSLALSCMNWGRGLATKFDVTVNGSFVLRMRKVYIATLLTTSRSIDIFVVEYCAICTSVNAMQEMQIAEVYGMRKLYLIPYSLISENCISWFRNGKCTII